MEKYMIPEYEFYENKILNKIPLSRKDCANFCKYYLQDYDKRLCTTCLIIFTNIKENFHIKRYYVSKDGIRHIKYDTTCRICKSAYNLTYRVAVKHDTDKYIKQFVPSIKSRAKTSQIPFDMTADYLKKQITIQDFKCYYTGEQLDFTLLSNVRNRPHREFPSLDRLVPELGYVENNVVWCKYEINRMKNDMTHLEFLDTCKNIIDIHNNI